MDTTWVVVILVGLLAGAVYFYAKRKGQMDKAKEVIDREEALDREEAQDELDEKRDNNAWDNLNDTIRDTSK